MKKILLAIIFIGVLAVAYYVISPFFSNIEVNDAEPVALDKTDITTEAIPSGFEDLTPEDQALMTEQMEEVNATDPLMMNDTLGDIPIKPAEKAEDMSDEEVQSEPQESQVMGTLGHPAEGTVQVIQTAEGQIIRYEDFSTINGPKLHVYLSKDLKAEEFIDLGPIKGTHGNINYSVPEDVNLSEYRYVLYWCVPFSVLFNYAEVR